MMNQNLNLHLKSHYSNGQLSQLLNPLQFIIIQIPMPLLIGEQIRKWYFFRVQEELKALAFVLQKAEVVVMTRDLLIKLKEVGFLNLGFLVEYLVLVIFLLLLLLRFKYFILVILLQFIYHLWKLIIHCFIQSFPQLPCLLRCSIANREYVIKIVNPKHDDLRP
jgi:hypothetical protein